MLFFCVLTLSHGTKGTLHFIYYQRIEKPINNLAPQRSTSTA
jgi:hypothetical protein